MNVLITGATSGIGQATALEFAKQQHTLIITGRRAERLAETKNKLLQAGAKSVHTICFDIRELSQVKNAIQSIPKEFFPIHVLVNNAGLASGLSTLQDGDVNDWEKMIDTNVKGLLYITREIAPLMVKEGKGHIVNVGSIAGKEVYANGNVYCATKHAVDALNKGMRIDLLPYGIKVTAVNPGMVETEFSVVRFHGDEERAKKVYEGITPLRAEDIAETIVWCVSRPAHVNINELLIMPTMQASASVSIRNNK